MATKLSRCEAEYMAACALVSGAKSCREGSIRFREAFTRRIVGKHFDASSGHMISEATYYAKECADAGVEAGIVSDDGVKVGPIMMYGANVISPLPQRSAKVATHNDKQSAAIRYLVGR